MVLFLRDARQARAFRVSFEAPSTDQPTAPLAREPSARLSCIMRRFQARGIKLD